MCDGRGSFAEDIREHIIELDVGNSKAVLGTVLLSGGETCELGAVAHQISELTDVDRWDKAAADKTVLERASGTHNDSVSAKADPTHLHVLCSVAVSSLLF